jgi:hypothetical protein
MARREKDKARDAVKSPVTTLKFTCPCHQKSTHGRTTAEEREVARRREGEQYSKRDSIT